jgi:hypothetical protein
MYRGKEAKNFLDGLQIVSTMFLDLSRAFDNSIINHCSHATMKWLDEHPNGSEPRRRTVYNLLLDVCRLSGELPSSIEILEVKFTSDTPIAAGSLSDTFVGTHNGNKVVIKRHWILPGANVTTWKVGSTTIQERATRRELVLTDQIQLNALVWRQLRHKNILEIKGVLSMDRGGPSIISPWMDNGSLREYIRTDKYKAQKHRIPLVCPGCTWKQSSGLT